METLYRGEALKVGWSIWIIFPLHSLQTFVAMGTSHGRERVHFRDTRRRVFYLPDADNSVSDEDEENDNRLNKGSGRFLSFLKQSQHLDEWKGQVFFSNIVNVNQPQRACVNKDQLTTQTEQFTLSFHLVIFVGIKVQLQPFIYLASGVDLTFASQGIQGLEKYLLFTRDLYPAKHPRASKKSGNYSKPLTSTDEIANTSFGQHENTSDNVVSWVVCSRRCPQW